MFAEEEVFPPQEEGLAPPTDGFLEVAYSFTGTTWQSLGRINAGNWQSFSPEIPLHSWEEAQNLQIVIAGIPTIDARPRILLDAVALELEYDRTFTETAVDVVEAITNPVEEVVSEVTEAVDQLANVLGIVEEAVSEPFSEVAEVAIAAPQDPEPASPIEEQKKVIIQEEKLTFTAPANLSTAAIVADAFLPWLTRELITLLGGEDALHKRATQAPLIAASNDGRSFKVEGTCGKDYFVVLLYHTSTDYQNDPYSFVFNYADRCPAGGNFSYDLGTINPRTLLPGTYYLLLAEEDAVGPWIPRSALIPLEIKTVMTERTL